MTDQTPLMQFRSIGDDDSTEENGEPTRLPNADDDEETGVIPDDLEQDKEFEDDGLGTENERDAL